MDYLLKSTICLTAFYGLYFFGFRRMSFHTLNRFYLLVSLVLSLTIPLLSYERTEVVVLEPQPIQETNFAVEETQENTDNQATAIQPTTSFENTPDKTNDLIQVLNTIYLLGVGVMFFLFLKNLLTIFYTIKNASTASCGTPPASAASSETSPASLSHRKLKILVTQRHSNSSFFNYVFLNPDNLNPHEEALIIAHEGFHAQRLHTLDLLVLGILKAIFWFNPIVYFYQKSLKQIHEYEVDALMAATHDSREYAHLLLKLGIASSAMIINQFSTKPLSERIQFLFKTPTKNMKKLLYFLSLPLIAVGVMAFAEEKVVKVYRETKSQKSILKKEQKTNLQLMIPVDTTTKRKIISTDIFTHKIDFNLNFDQMDSVSIYANNKILIEGQDYIIKGKYAYLDQKYEKSKVGIRIVSSNVGGLGSYYLYPNLTKLEHNTYPIFDKIKALPIFTVSNKNTFAQFTSKLPKLPTPFSKVAQNQDTLRTVFETNKLGKNPLVIINRVEYPSSILYRINPEAIENQDISSQKDKNTVLLYGEKAKDGCIEIITKKGVDIFLKNDEKRKTVLENVAKQVQESKKRVKREIVKNKNYERISIISLDDSYAQFSVDIPIGEQALFILNGKIVSEEDIDTSNQKFVSGGCGKIGGSNSADLIIKFGESIKQYDSYFILNTK